MKINTKESSWYQKYRPQTIEDIILPVDMKKEFENMIKANKLSYSMLFHSRQPGTGKTSLAKALCNDLGVKPLMINASKDTSIDTIRQRVATYAIGASVFVTKCPHKVVILDEAERLSPQAQESLKGIMESVSKSCVFILTTNNKNSVVDPLIDRCVLYSFDWEVLDTDNLIKAQMIQRIIDILKLEGYEIDPELAIKFIQDCFPSMRRAIQTIQSYTLRFPDEINLGPNLLTFTTRNYFETDHSVDYVIDLLLQSRLKGEEFKSVLKWCKDNEAYSAALYDQIFERLQGKVKDFKMAAIILAINEAQKSHNIVKNRVIHYAALMVEINDIIFGG